MAKKINKFSAFKLFYDEFIYKREFNYQVVSRNLDAIKKEVFKVRKTSKVNLDNYKVVLERANKRIRIELNEIYDNNPNIFELYYLLYKANAPIVSDQVKDMPFVISCSFYDDYRLDNKSVEELENSDYVIPIYTSLEKKQIKIDAEGTSRLLYFIELIKNSEESYRFDRFIRTLNDLLIDLRPVNEKHFDFFAKIEDKLKVFKHSCVRFLKRLESVSDIDDISARYKIVFRKDLPLEYDEFKSIFLEHFDELYKKHSENSELAKGFLYSNNMSYESYKALVNEYTKEKNRLQKAYDNDRFEELSDYDSSDLTRFKNTLINAYFDNRYITDFDLLETPYDYANRAIEYYVLAEMLDDQMYEKVIFDSCHSKKLGRNGDVNSALLEKLYYLYNPFDLLARYEKSRKEFELNLSRLGAGFVKDYSSVLNDLKIKRDYHGPIPTKDSIIVKLNSKRKDFLYEQCITELKNYNESNSYDTRNYDLDVVADGLTSDELVSCYQMMKYKISTFDFNSMMIIDKNVNENTYERNELLKALQEFIARNILNYLKFGELTEEQRNNRLKDICYTYLDEKCLFINGEKINTPSDINKFNNIKKKYREKSKWCDLLKKYNIK